MAEWIEKNESLFVNAVVNSYTVEKEPKVHNTKIKPNFLADIVSGIKTFEIRKNDRGYKKGAILNL